MKIKFFFAWFDFRVGFYYDHKGRALYVCPLPCFVFKVWRNPTTNALGGATCYRFGCNKLAGDTGYCDEHAPF